MPNKSKHRPYNEDPNAGLTLTYGKRALNKLADAVEAVNSTRKRTRSSVQGTADERRAARKVERNRKSAGGGNK